MIRINVEEGALLLSGDLQAIGIFTDLPTLNVEIAFAEGGTILSGKYYATDGLVRLYDVRSLLEEALTDRAVADFRIVATSVATATTTSTTSTTSTTENTDADTDTSTNTTAASEQAADERAEVTFSMLYCNHAANIPSAAEFVEKNFLTAARSRRIAPNEVFSLWYYPTVGTYRDIFVYADYIAEGVAGHASFVTENNGLAKVADVYETHINTTAIAEKVAEIVGTEIELTGITIRCNNRAATFFIDKALRDAPLFRFRNCFNAVDTLRLQGTTKSKTSTERSAASINGVSQWYDENAKTEYELESIALDIGECELARQMCLSREVRVPSLAYGDTDDFDAMDRILISDFTCELSDTDEKPNNVKVTWRYADNRPAVLLRVSTEIFTEHFNFVYQ